MVIKIVLDDVRHVHNIVFGELKSFFDLNDEERKELKQWILVRRAHTMIQLLADDAEQQKEGHPGNLRIDEISLDHDLGTALTGWDVQKWLLEKIETDKYYIPPVVRVHTANMAVYQKMCDTAKSMNDVRVERMKKQGLL